MQKSEHKRLCSLKECVMSVTVTLLILSCLFLTLMISKSIVINQENQILLERILAVTSEKSNNGDVMKALDKDSPAIINQDEVSPHPPQQLVQIKSSCPPCPTTPRPDPVDGHLNPVGILNEVTRTRATYDCIHSCVHPVIHISYLTINDPCCTGKTWEGVGKSKAMSKQSAAYKALQEMFPGDAANVAPQNIPPVYNPGTCQIVPDPLLLETRAKC